jgi:prophage regulatory protein
MYLLGNRRFRDCPESIFDGDPMVQNILRLREVQSATGLARSSIYAGMSAGTFPKSIPLSEKAVGWLESEIEQWQESRIAARAVRAA